MAAKIKVKVEIGEGIPLWHFRLFEYLLVVLPPGGIDDTEKNQLNITGILDPLHRVGRDLDDIARLDRRLFIVDMHSPGAAQDIVEFIGGESMSPGVKTGGNDSVGKRVSSRERVGAVRMGKLTQARIITGDNLGTLA